jgi:hypothetical protein
MHGELRIPIAIGSPIIVRMEGALRCPVCKDAIGVYESLLVLDGDDSRTSSIAREPQLQDGEHQVMHLSCGLSSNLSQAAA